MGVRWEGWQWSRRKLQVIEALTFLIMVTVSQGYIPVMCMCVLSCFSRVWLFVTPWTVACQVPLSMGFSRQEYCSGLPCPSPGGFRNPGIKPRSLAFAGGFFTIWASKGSPNIYIYTMEYYSTKKRNKNGSFAAVVAMWMNLDSANKADFHWALWRECSVPREWQAVAEHLWWGRGDPLCFSIASSQAVSTPGSANYSRVWMICELRRTCTDEHLPSLDYR